MTEWGTAYLVVVLEFGKEGLQQFQVVDHSCVAQPFLGWPMPSASLGDVIDSLYFIFYENLDHIKALVTDEAVRKEEAYQCIFRLKHIRTDFRHDNEHGGSSKINAKIKNIGESYAHYTGKVALTSKKDFQTAQKKLFDEFDELSNHLIERIES